MAGSMPARIKQVNPIQYPRGVTHRAQTPIARLCHTDTEDAQEWAYLLLKTGSFRIRIISLRDKWIGRRVAVFLLNRRSTFKPALCCNRQARKELADRQRCFRELDVQVFTVSCLIVCWFQQRSFLTNHGVKV